MPKMIRMECPTRIDIAGGTLDIWPLSVIFAPAACVNAAINLSATVQAKAVRRKGVSVNARHFGKTFRYSKNTPEERKTLFHRALDFMPVDGWEFTADCLSPSGAGLGGSSSLLIAFLRALDRIAEAGLSDEEILEAAKNIEARHLGIPTGVQDYVAALRGGVNAVACGKAGFTFETLDIPPGEIERRTVLAYSGASRISGIPNWRMLKNAVEKRKATVDAFGNIAANSLEVRHALARGEFNKVGRLIDFESFHRERLGRAIVTPVLRRAFSAARKKGGHPKVCGAGGGGCFLVWCEPEEKAAIAAAMGGLGMRVLDFRIVEHA